MSQTGVHTKPLKIVIVGAGICERFPMLTISNYGRIPLIHYLRWLICSVRASRRGARHSGEVLADFHQVYVLMATHLVY